MRLRIARNAAELDQFRGLWDDLHRRSDRATIFQSFAWNRLAAVVFAARESPYVVAAESDSGAALIPAALNCAGLTLLGESLFDYRDVLSTGDPAALDAAWAELGGLGLPLAVSALRGEWAQNRWRTLGPEPFVNAPQVRPSEIGAEEFARRHSRLGRTLRRISREGVSLHLYCGEAGRVARWIYRRKADSGLAGNLFSDPARVDFMVAACGLAGADCNIFILERSEPVAGLVTFRDRGVRRFYTIYFDPAVGRLSPGTSLLFEITRRSLAEGLDCDYMTGEQPHKSRFMTSRVPLFRVNARPELLAQAGGAQPRFQRAA